MISWDHFLLRDQHVVDLSLSLGGIDVVSGHHFLFGCQHVVDLSLSLGVMMWSLGITSAWVSAYSRSKPLPGGDDVVSGHHFLFGFPVHGFQDELVPVVRETVQQRCQDDERHRHDLQGRDVILPPPDVYSCMIQKYL